MRNTVFKVPAPGLELSNTKLDGGTVWRLGALTERQPPLLSSCGSLGKSCTFSAPQFVHLLKGDDEIPGECHVSVIFVIICALMR